MIPSALVLSKCLGLHQLRGHHGRRSPSLRNRRPNLMRTGSSMPTSGMGTQKTFAQSIPTTAFSSSHKLCFGVNWMTRASSFWRPTTWSYSSLIIWTQRSFLTQSRHTSEPSAHPALTQNTHAHTLQDPHFLGWDASVCPEEGDT